MSDRRVIHYFAYGSNMNPARVRERGLRAEEVRGAALLDRKLVFDKVSRRHPGAAHANIVHAPGERVEGVLYRLSGAEEILKMDPFERAPWNYGRDVVFVHLSRQPNPAGEGSSVGLDSGPASAAGASDSVAEIAYGPRVPAWTYFANQAARRQGLKPPAEYLAHMLAGERYLSKDYFERLAHTEVALADASAAKAAAHGR